MVASWGGTCRVTEWVVVVVVDWWRGLDSVLGRERVVELDCSSGIS